jgi:tetratricopeptide (TPR) repeat protein
MQDFEGAEQDFSSAIDLYPGLIHAYRDRSIIRLARNDLIGYTEDKNTVDSLLQIRVPGFDLSEISYLKTITGFSSDFTPAERVRNSRVQYSERDIHMISVFHIAPRMDQYDQSYKRIEDLRLYSEPGEPVLLLEMKNYDYTIPGESIVQRVEKAVLSGPHSESDKLLLESLVLGWQMKYRDAISVLDEADQVLGDNYIAWFIRGNYNFAIAEIISSIENQDHYSTDGNTTMMEYYRAALKDYNRSLELKPDFIYSLFNRAFLLSLSEEIDPAIEDYTSCIEHEPQLGEAYFNRGLLKIYSNESIEGCRDLSLAGELGIEASYKVIYKFCKE